jgi:hypothetical protein
MVEVVGLYDGGRGDDVQQKDQQLYIELSGF